MSGLLLRLRHRGRLYGIDTGGSRLRRSHATLGTQSQSNQRQRPYFAVGIEVLVLLEALQSFDRSGIPGSVHGPLEVAFIRERLLNLLVAIRGRLLLQRRTAGYHPAGFRAGFRSGFRHGY